jgi:hypothetical protein
MPLGDAVLGLSDFFFLFVSCSFRPSSFVFLVGRDPKYISPEGKSRIGTELQFRLVQLLLSSSYLLLFVSFSPLMEYWP